MNELEFVDYKKLYHIMVDASERALEQLEQNIGRPQDIEFAVLTARQILIEAEQRCEDLYIDAGDEE